MKIFQCPGHGGRNRGCNHGGLYENDWTLEFSRDCGPSLMVLGAEVQLARESDTFISYRDRAKNAEKWGADLVLCHHINASVYPRNHEKAGEIDPYPRGAWTMIMPGDSVGYQVGRRILQVSPNRNSLRPIRCSQSDWTASAFGVMEPYREKRIPVVLIEWGFATNPDERSFLKSRTHRYTLVASVVSAVARFAELKGIPWTR